MGWIVQRKRRHAMLFFLTGSVYESVHIVVSIFSAVLGVTSIVYCAVVENDKASATIKLMLCCLLAALYCAYTMMLWMTSRCLRMYHVCSAVLFWAGLYALSGELSSREALMHALALQLNFATCVDSSDASRSIFLAAHLAHMVCAYAQNMLLLAGVLHPFAAVASATAQQQQLAAKDQPTLRTAAAAAALAQSRFSAAAAVAPAAPHHQHQTAASSSMLFAGVKQRRPWP